ncbi:MAG: BREX system P-loop protein BrxC [Acidobacteria bacterium]|nr:MAG: BREX system P-loop protein BrxC [Acidobacteriota bacterium]
MNVGDILQRDPAKHRLINNGQARLTEDGGERVSEELQGELSTFVCEGQYADGMHRIISSYLSDLNKTSQKGAWVSGFFGSGKSHLLKMLAHLWQNTEFSDGSTARSLPPEIPSELRALFLELDTAGKREGGLFAAAGTLLGGSDHVRVAVLSIILRGAGLPSSAVAARCALWLHEEGLFEKVRASVERNGRSFESVLLNLYASKELQRAILEADPQFASSEAQAREILKAQFSPLSGDLSTDEFVRLAKQALFFRSRNKRMPCTLIVLDEVQQYIGDSHDRSTVITEVAEALSKQFDSKVMIVAAGQSALSGQTSNLGKLADRFSIMISLSDTDVETVTRKVLLRKKPTAIGSIKDVIEKHSGEVSRQLQSTSIGEVSADRVTIVDDYPLLPVRRRFWEQCFRVVDAAGTQSQLRSQLRILHDSVAKLSDRPLGAVIPGDELYESLAPNMVETQVLDRTINERIIDLSKDGTEEGVLARRICGLVFLIGKLPREVGADIGVRAKADHIADLLVDDIRAENGKLRARIATRIEELVKDATLMQMPDGEVRLQTKEGAEWNREFLSRQAKFRDSTRGELQIKRDELLYAELERVVRQLAIKQGMAKIGRSLSVRRDQSMPAGEDHLVLWARDGWSDSEKNVRDAARAAGSDSALIITFIPNKSAEPLNRAIIETEAASQTIDAKGNIGSGTAAAEARQSMEARRAQSKAQRDKLITEIVASAKVFQGGGNELHDLTLEAKLREAAMASLIRLFPRFKDADGSTSNWEAAVKRARDGAEHPFQPLGYTGPVEQHAVSQQVLIAIGAGSSGTEVRKQLKSSPFGWPQDAIDAALLALHRHEHLSVRLNGVVLRPGQLDQNKIAKAEFRVEKTTLTVLQKLAVRKAFALVGVACKSGEEQARGPEFVHALQITIAAAGGEPPMPPPPVWLRFDEIGAATGTQQLLAVANAAAELETNVPQWKASAELIATRLPGWKVLGRLAAHACDLPDATPIMEEIEAILAGRLLLQPHDPVSPQLKALCDLLRAKLLSLQAEQQRAHDDKTASLAATDVWKKLTEAQRREIFAGVQLAPPEPLDVSSTDALLASLDRRSLSAREADVHALSSRVQNAIERAARLLEPKVRRVSLTSATLHTRKDVDTWIDQQRTALLEAIEDGPVLV